MNAMQEEIGELTAAVTQLASQQQPPAPDPAQIASAVISQATEAVREEIAPELDAAVQSLQHALQSNSTDVMRSLMPKLDRAVEYGDIVTRLLKQLRDQSEHSSII